MEVTVVFEQRTSENDMGERKKKCCECADGEKIVGQMHRLQLYKIVL